MCKNFNIGLTFKERLLLPKIFPQRATLEEQLIVRDIIIRFAVTEEEKKELNFRRTPQGWIWDTDKEKCMDSGFTNKEVNFLLAQLKRLDTERAVTQDLVELCLKIKMLKEEKQDENKNTK